MIKGYKADMFLFDECVDGVALTPYEERKKLSRERKEAVKGRDLDRRQKRKDKRSQCY